MIYITNKNGVVWIARDLPDGTIEIQAQRMTPQKEPDPETPVPLPVGADHRF